MPAIDKGVMMHIGAVADRGDAEGIELVKRAGHDHVIAATGTSRLSGVTWSVMAADDPETLSWLRENWSDPGLMHFIATNPRGAIVVSSCEHVG